jgi:hypothetical protein
MRMPLVTLLLVPASLCSAAPMTVYDNMSGSPIGAYAQQTVNNAVFGDALTLAHAGTLNTLTLTLYNSPASTGSVEAGNMLVNFYDNSTPYTGGTIANPVLGSVSFAIDFAPGGLSRGLGARITEDLSAYNISLTTEILITQQFEMTSGSAEWLGVLRFPDPTTGSSPDTVYIASSTVSAGLYSFSTTVAQFGYTLTIPEPSAALAGGSLLLLLRRRPSPAAEA